VYKEYASIAAECGLQDATTLQLATRFFHDVGELRYFGVSTASQEGHASENRKASNRGGYDSDGDDEGNGGYIYDDVLGTLVPAQGKKSKAAKRVSYGSDSDDEGGGEPDRGYDAAQAGKTEGPGADGGDHQPQDMLTTTVFPNPFWIVDVLRGLIRHDHSAVLGMIKSDPALSTKERRTLRRRVFRLMQRGLLHDSLLKYVWHGVAGASEDSAANEDEFARLIALMKAFDILMDKTGATDGAEWIVPTLAAGKHARTIESEGFLDDSLPFVCRLVYDALPPYFDMILVAHVMNARIADAVEFIEG
jgi:hypothetical protein